MMSQMPQTEGIRCCSQLKSRIKWLHQVTYQPTVTQLELLFATKRSFNQRKEFCFVSEVLIMHKILVISSTDHWQSIIKAVKNDD